MVLRYCTALVVMMATLSPASAQQQLRIGIGYGLAFLPIYICQDLKLIEKHAKAAQLEVKASFPRFTSAAGLRDAIGAGEIDMAPFGTAALLAAWDQAKDTPGQIFAVSGITSLPLVLLSNQPNTHALADLRASDRIAVPTSSSPQTYLLELQAEKTLGGYDRLRDRVVVMSHADAIATLVDGTGQVTAYFASPPFTQFALRDANVHALFTSADVMNGKSSFLVMGATKAYMQAQPQMPEIIDKAIDDAAKLIHDDPRHAAQIYLTHEPSKTLDGAGAAAVVREIKDEFGSAVYGMQTMADFMGRHGELKAPPRSWKDIVAPALLNSPSS